MEGRGGSRLGEGRGEEAYGGSSNGREAPAGRVAGQGDGSPTPESVSRVPADGLFPHLDVLGRGGQLAGGGPTESPWSDPVRLGPSSQALQSLRSSARVCVVTWK